MVALSKSESWLNLTGLVVQFVPEYSIRTNFFNIIIETYQKYSSISLQEEIDNNFVDEFPADWEDYYYPTFIPDNFELISTNEFGSSKHITFENNSSQYIKIIQSGMNFESQIDMYLAIEKRNIWQSKVQLPVPSILLD